MPCFLAALWSSTAPFITPWSVSPIAGWPKLAARSASFSILQAPSSSEYSEWTWRCAQPGGVTDLPGYETRRTASRPVSALTGRGLGRAHPAIFAVGYQPAMVDERFRVLAFDDVEEVPWNAGMTMRPIRGRLGLRAFGAAGFRAADRGDLVIEPHTEASGRGHE